VTGALRAPNHALFLSHSHPEGHVRALPFISTTFLFIYKLPGLRFTSVSTLTKLLDILGAPLPQTQTFPATWDPLMNPMRKRSPVYLRARCQIMEDPGQHCFLHDCDSNPTCPNQLLNDGDDPFSWWTINTQLITLRTLHHILHKPSLYISSLEIMCIWKQCPNGSPQGGDVVL